MSYTNDALDNMDNDDRAEDAPLMLNADDQKKVKHVIEVGLAAYREIADLREGLRETVNDVAKELKIKPAVLNKAIRVAFKSSVTNMQNEVDTVETLLHAAGRA